METFDIKPCPYCENKNAVLRRNFDRVQCNFCGASGTVHDGHPEDAVNSWNNLYNLVHKIKTVNVLIWSNDDYLEVSCYNTVEQRKKIIKDAFQQYPLCDMFHDNGKIEKLEDFPEEAYENAETFIETLSELDLISSRFNGCFCMKEIEIKE